MTTFYAAFFRFCLRGRPGRLGLLMVGLGWGLAPAIQAQNLVWARQFSSSIENETGYSVAVDGAGNVYITGVFRETADFDPGPGETILTAAGDDDIFISKLDGSGNLVWARQFGSAYYETVSSLAVDGAGNVYTTGVFSETVDFDPGPGETILNSADASTFLSKLDGSGNLVWAIQFQSDISEVAVDGAGNIFTTGNFTGTNDMDPGPGETNLTAAGYTDIYVSKLDGSGNLVWVKQMSGTYQGIGRSVALDGAGNVYTTGNFSETVDFDPGPGETILTAVGNEDNFVSKLDGSGNLIWVRQFGGLSPDISRSMAVDGSGNVYTTGVFGETVDFDPGPGETNLTAVGIRDIFVSKLDGSGNLVWARQMGGPDVQQSFSVAVDGAGNVYTTGYFRGTADFDPGPGVTNLTTDNQDIFVSKLGPPAPLTLTTSATPNPVCAGASLALSVTATGGSAPFSYTWVAPAGITLSATSTSAVSASVGLGVSGPQTFTLTVASDPGLATSTTLVSVTVYDRPPAPVLSLSPFVTQPILTNTPGVTLTVSGCGAGTIQWLGATSSGTGSSISVPTSATGTLVYSATCTVGSCTSPAGSVTVTINPPLVSGSFDGFVNGADCATFRGWAWDRNKVNTAVSVDILDGANVIATLLAGDFRQDLQTAGKGNGKHAFSWSIPASLKDGLSHHLTARVSGSSFILKDSPKALICQGTSTPTNKAPVPPSPTVLVAPLSAQVGVPFSGTLVAFTDPENQPLTYALSGLPDGLSINMTSRVIAGTPTQSGTFVLAYAANDGVLTNSVSFPLTVNPASTTTVTGNFEGYLDKVECGTIRGWVWDRKLPNTPVTVEFYTGGTVWGSVVANIYRDDLKNAGKGNGNHAYSFEVPAALKDGQTRLIYARVQGSTYVLKDSGKPLTCFSPTRLSAETPAELLVRVLGNPVTDQVVVEVRGAQGQPLRLEVTDLSGRRVAERQIEQAGEVEHQSLSVGSHAIGLLLLRATSGQRSVTLKVLKP
jgi:hypothetical protein